MPAFYGNLKNRAAPQKKKNNSVCHHSMNCEICTATHKHLNKYDIQNFLDAHEAVVKSGKFNYEECRIPVNTHMNIPFLRSWLTDFHDKKLCDFLEFGFPLGLKKLWFFS